MNKSWLNLIILGVVILVAAIAWEIYQDNSGYRSKIDTTVTEYKQTTLLNPKLEQHLVNDPDYANAGSSSTDNGTSSSLSS